MTQREKDIRKAAKLYKGDKATLNKMTAENLASLQINLDFIVFVLKMIVKYGPSIVKDIIDYIKAHN